MENLSMKRTEEVFVDTAMVIALLIETDEHHAEAWSAILSMQRTAFVTTRAVCLEIGSALSRPRYRPLAVEVLASIENDPAFEVVPLLEDLYAEGLTLFTARTDKAWSLTDCLSFAVMRKRGITTA